MNEFLGGLEFYIPIYALYLEEQLNSLFYVSLMLALKSIMILILEIPTGAIADLFGRKKSLITGRLCSIIAVTFFFLGGSIFVLALGVIFSASANSFASGTNTSFLYESIENISQGNKPSFKKANGIMIALWPIGASISSLAGGYLSTISLRLPFLIAVIPFVVALVSLSLMIEPHERDNHFLSNSGSIINQSISSIRLIRSNRQLLIIFSVGFFSFALGEVTHQLKPIFFDYKNIELEYFGILFAIAFALSFIGSLLSDPISRIIGNKTTLIVTFFIAIPMQIIAVLITGLFSGILVTVGSISWGIRWPILSELANKEVANSQRATVISTAAFANNLGFILTSPLVGFWLEFTNINVIYFVEAIISLVILVPYFYLKEPVH